MSEITVYAFEEEDDQPATDWTTMDSTEARQYAVEHRYSLIARTFEYTDPELIEDYRPGHALDGTLLDAAEPFARPAPPAIEWCDAHRRYFRHTGGCRADNVPTMAETREYYARNR